MQFRSYLCSQPPNHWLICLVACLTTALQSNAAGVQAAENHRLTPLVQAVKGCSPSVVNLRGRKSVPDDSDNSLVGGQKLKQVNGMGTGVVIDSRGYVLTNYHVVQGVREIEVTTSSNEKTTARLIAHDPASDLAILKINTREPLPEIKLGTSSDLMLAETVIAVGNAYGYEHTVTVGIISQLGRTVQVNETQVYRNLIQTDTAINPGNSGGPLLNMNGEMIGINVAVRIGAQGIAFAIPVNDALEIAADLMSQVVSDKIYHGITVGTVYESHQPRMQIKSVEAGSPADVAGLKRGDVITRINDQAIDRDLDFYTALLGAAVGQTIEISATQERKSIATSMVLKFRPATINSNTSLAWETLGVRLDEVGEAELANEHPNYKRGLRVKQVRSGSPAELEGIMSGDVIVAMHGYKTESLENLAYVLQQSDVLKRESFMFYILRNKEPFWGKMRVAQVTTP